MVPAVAGAIAASSQTTTAVQKHDTRLKFIFAFIDP
jgi:hypothetical protein